VFGFLIKEGCQLESASHVGLLAWFVAQLRCMNLAMPPHRICLDPDQRLVYTKDFAAYGRIELTCGLDRLDNADRAAILHLLADVRELNKGHVAKLFLSVVCYSNGPDTVLDDDIFMIWL
jgi:hypothetical protein